MGGFSTLGEAVFGLAEKGLSEAGAKFPKIEALTEGAQTVINKTFGLDSTLTGKSGAFVKQHLTKFESEFDKQLSIGTQEAQKLGPGVVPRHAIETQARRAARDKVFGQNDELLSAATHAMALEHGEEKAKNFVDNLGVYFHEQVRDKQNAGQFSARLTTNIKKTKQIAPVAGLTEGGANFASDIELNPSPYNRRAFINDKPGLEASLHSYGSAALAFKAGLAHTTTPLNALIGNSLSSFAKASGAMFGSGYDAARQELQAHNALGSMFLEELDQMYKFKNGTIQKYAPGTIGEFVHKNWAIPGFSALRQRTATMFAMQGKYSAIEYAHDLMSGDADKVRRAKLNFEYLGIKPNEVMQNGGNLTPEHIRQAMFENTNQKLFIQSAARNRSQFATSNAMGRLVSMYHGYGAAQANFIQKELIKAYKLRDPMSMLKTMAVLGVVFPAVGTAVHSLEQVWMHPSNAGEKFDESIAKMKQMGSSADIEDRLEGIANVAGFGVMTSYGRAAGRRKLLESMAGPVINAAAELGQDAANARTNPEPLARDVLHDIPSLGIGSWAADKFLPNQKEVNKRKPMTSRRLAARKAAMKRKAKQAALKGE